jgi:large subunit ribosomal protein L13
MMKTYVCTPDQFQKRWYLVDAKDKVLGRVASKVAATLRGKNKPSYTPFMDMGDNVVVINADKVRLTGGKPLKKVYYHHSGYPGGIKEVRFADVMRKDPTFPLKTAIKGMLPHNRLGRRQFLHVKVYAGESHPHQAQMPEPLPVP